MVIIFNFLVTTCEVIYYNTILFIKQGHQLNNNNFSFYKIIKLTFCYVKEAIIYNFYFILSDSVHMLGVLCTNKLYTCVWGGGE